MALDERWHEYARTRSRELRNELVEANLGLGAHIAQRYSTRGIDEDVRQVAFLALVKAVERFDPTRGVPFSAFAGRTIEGEIKRYFRDSSWTLRVPRAVQERSLGVARLSEQLAQRLGRSPSVSELADYLHVSNDEVIEAIAAGSAARPQSIDVAEDGHVPSALGSEDNALLGVLDRVLVERLMAILPEREREIVRLRYFEQMSQTGIAEVIGISQMHVSRLLRRSLDALNVLLVDGADRDGADMVTSD
ncbi:MAG: sigma-70 family RNA polymerase sigma factor [Actinomycetota bacterium]|nr:sigma-70 family RNA polymerase sigma factor [Actinomycetota bacterium]